MMPIFNILSTFFSYLLHQIRGELSAIFHDSGVLLLIVIALPLYTIIYSTAYGGEVVRDVSIAVVD